MTRQQAVEDMLNEATGRLRDAFPQPAAPILDAVDLLCEAVRLAALTDVEYLIEKQAERDELVRNGLRHEP